MQELLGVELKLLQEHKLLFCPLASGIIIHQRPQVLDKWEQAGTLPGGEFGARLKLLKKVGRRVPLHLVKVGKSEAVWDLGAVLEGGHLKLHGDIEAVEEVPANHE